MMRIRRDGLLLSGLLPETPLARLIPAYISLFPMRPIPAKTNVFKAI